MRNPRGEGLQSGYILFNNVENATKALETLQGTQTPKGETLNLAYARAQKKAVKCRRLYYSGCNGDESEILTIFQQFSKSIIEVCVCMLLTLFNFCTKNSHRVTLNSEGFQRRIWFYSFRQSHERYKSVGDP